MNPFTKRFWFAGAAVGAGALICVDQIGAEVRVDHATLRIEPLDPDEILENLQSEDDHTRAEAFRTLMSEHQYLKKKLIEIVEKENPPYGSGHPRHLAVRLLQEFGSREAIPVFIKHIEYRQDMVAGTPSFVDGYPCAMALVKTGRGVAPFVIEYLRNPEPDPLERRRREMSRLPPIEVSDKAIELLAWVFVYTYGLHEDGTEEAIAVIRHARRRAPQNENLGRLLNIVETLTDAKKRSQYIQKHYVQPQEEPKATN